MWGFQLWVNLPREHKMASPRYQDIAPERIPEVDLGHGVRARVIAGRLPLLSPWRIRPASM